MSDRKLTFRLIVAAATAATILSACASATTAGGFLRVEGTYLISTLIFSALAFFLIKGIFKFYSWVYPETDEIHREHLDRLIDRLDRTSLFLLGKSIIDRIVVRTYRHISSHPKSFYLWMTGLSLLINVVMFVGTLVVTVSSHFSDNRWGVFAILSTVRNAGWIHFFLLNLLVGILGTVADLVSLHATLSIVKRIQTVRTGRGLIGHFVLDVLVAILSCAWALLVFVVMHYLFADLIRPTVNFFSGGNPNKYMGNSPLETLKVNSAMWGIIVAAGVSGAFPSIAYLLVLLPILSLRLIPRKIQDFMNKILFQLTTDEERVFRSLANFFGGLGALSVIAAKLIARL